MASASCYLGNSLPLFIHQLCSKRCEWHLPFTSSSGKNHSLLCYFQSHMSPQIQMRKAPMRPWNGGCVQWWAMLWRSGPTHSLKDRDTKDLILYMLGLSGGWQRRTGNRQKTRRVLGKRENGMMEPFSLASDFWWPCRKNTLLLGRPWSQWEEN